MNKQRSSYFILTGSMGAGKSTILKQLRNHGVMAIDEPARQILAAQRSIDGDGVPEKDPKLFTELLLSRSIYQYQQMQDFQGSVIFDRGIPDNIGYAALFNLSTKIAESAAHQYRYNDLVFFTPGWKDIYENDFERKMFFEQANQFGNDIKAIYETLGYQIVAVPLGPPELRANFILKSISDNILNIKY